mmetsp:Transcript_9446/g.24489  ORF Transcript_9446/g.24489 Transcript_9446/m.24489 type:complete len:230 (-) Transcript_9446:1627-2316(-)
MYLFDEWPTSSASLRAIDACEFLADWLARRMSLLSSASEAFARRIRSFTASCISLYWACSASLTPRRTTRSRATISFCLRCSTSSTFCRCLASRSRPACCSACALASTISAFAARNCRLVEISLSSFRSRSSSLRFSFFFCCTRSATSSTHCSRNCFCASSTSFFLCFTVSCLACDSSLARSRIFASVSAFSLSSRCLSSLLSSCLSRLSSTSLACWAFTMSRRSCSSA